MKISKSFALFTFIGILLGLLIYWREYDINAPVSIFHVLIWQIVIWVPWAFSFKVFEKVIEKTHQTKFGILQLFVASLLWVGLHFGWFFFMSTNFSPYIGHYGCRFGVFRYFFIFWTLIDIGIVWFVIEKIRGNKIQEVSPPLLLELTRGKNKYFCEPSQIHLLASENYYTKIFTSEGIFVMRKPLKYFQDVLPQDMFKKIHRSTIVNINQVSEMVRGVDHRLEIIMKDGTRRRVSRNFAKEIILFFKDRTS